ncbi:MAG: AMP-binding protein [Caldilineaceae bacterium]|nr:AMP-binding protein [Caldilineaceae bacterium]
MSSHPWTAHYEEGVPATVEIPEVPLRQILADAAAQYPEQIALNMTLRYLPLGIKIRSRLTYRQLEEESNRFAAGLAQLGVQKGDRVAVMLPNLPQSVVAFFGVLKAGAIVVNTNPTYTPRELEHQLHDSGAETIIMLSGLYDRLQQIRAKTNVKRVIITDISATLAWPFSWLVARQMRQRGMMASLATAPDLYRYGDLVNSQAPLPNMESTPNDVALFQYTGGTTGKPKAAMLTNRNLLGNVKQVGAWFSKAVPGQEKVLAAIPFFHVYGMTVAMLFAVDHGAEMVIMPDPRDIEMVMQIIEREQITIYPGVPAMYIAINNHSKVGQHNLRSIKSCFSGASSLPVHVATKFEELTGGRLAEGYGLTECSPVVTGNPLFGERRVGTIGVPMPNTEVAVVSLTPDEQDNYAMLEQGEEGELVVRGPQVMKG